MDKFILGLIINPIAGMGGSVGLKGTDGRKILSKAIKLGAKPSSPQRTELFLKGLEPIKNKLKFITCPNYMGEITLNDMEFNYELITHPVFTNIRDLCDSTSENTKIAGEFMKNMQEISLIVFVGGDGTARDILSVVGKEKPCLGIPAGVKIYSSVFALNPSSACSIVLQYLWGDIPLKQSEVLDIDEDEYRKDRLISRIYGYMFTPYASNYSQLSKMGSPDSDLNNQEKIAKKIIETLEEDVYYLIGPGTTTKAIADRLNQPKTVLGVDLLLNQKIIALDLNEQRILSYLTRRRTLLIVSPIGRQGIILGRGNLQLSPKVLRRIGSENLIIVSTKYKLQSISGHKLKLDTRDPELDRELTGLYKVITDYDELRICKVE
jgi:predicted polyphosphate/ATP-dependent NAD kinase